MSVSDLRKKFEKMINSDPNRDRLAEEDAELAQESFEKLKITT